MKLKRCLSVCLILTIIGCFAYINIPLSGQQPELNGTDLRALAAKSNPPTLELFSQHGGVLLKKWHGIKNFKPANYHTTFVNQDGLAVSIHGDGVIIVVTGNP